VLEREGFAVVPASDSVGLSVCTDDSGWRADDGEVQGNGADFASLAAFLRGRSTRA